MAQGFLLGNSYGKLRLNLYRSALLLVLFFVHAHDGPFRETRHI